MFVSGGQWSGTVACGWRWQQGTPRQPCLLLLLAPTHCLGVFEAQRPLACALDLSTEAGPQLHGPHPPSLTSSSPPSPPDCLPPSLPPFSPHRTPLPLITRPSSPAPHLLPLPPAGRHDEAIVSYRQALSLRSDFPEAFANYVHSLQCVCEWRDRPALFVRLEAEVRRDLAAGRLPSVQPFHAMAYPFPADLALQISAKYAEFCASVAARLALPALAHPPAALLEPGQRLRVGYVSSDFGNHPLSHLMGSVFGLHDKRCAGLGCDSVLRLLRAAEGCLVTAWPLRAWLPVRVLLLPLGPLLRLFPAPTRRPPILSTLIFPCLGSLPCPAPDTLSALPAAVWWRCSATRSAPTMGRSGGRASRRRRSTFWTSAPGGWGRLRSGCLRTAST